MAIIINASRVLSTCKYNSVLSRYRTVINLAESNEIALLGCSASIPFRLGKGSPVNGWVGRRGKDYIINKADLRMLTLRFLVTRLDNRY